MATSVVTAAAVVVTAATSYSAVAASVVTAAVVVVTAAVAAVEAAASSASGVALCKRMSDISIWDISTGGMTSISQSNLELEMQQLADLWVRRTF